MALLVSSPEDLKKVVSENDAPELFEYVRMGGILRIEKGRGLHVVYPTKVMIKERIKELREKERTLVLEISKLKRLEHRRKFFDLLKIRHALTSILDKEYREVAEKIEAERLLHDKRGRKILEELLKNREYRRKVKEALEESPVYRNRKFGDFIEKTKDIKGKLLDQRIKRLQEALKRTREEINILEGLLRWVKS